MSGDARSLARVRPSGGTDRHADLELVTVLLDPLIITSVAGPTA